MTAKQLASLLNEREIMKEITSAEERQAADAGLVVVFGYSDDNMEFRGAINDEVSCFDGGTAYVTKDGLFFEPNVCHKSACPHYAAAKNTTKSIKAVWHDEGAPYWTFETDIPHETFDIYEDGEVFCVGIVFSKENLALIDPYEGLKSKYIVQKSDTGETVDGCFVLRPDKDSAAVVALRAYARATDNEALAADIIKWVGVEKNEPLGLEQISNMGGKPYWHVGLQDNSSPSHWAILPDHVAKCPQDYFYGKHWLAYRYELKGGGSIGD